MSNHASHSMELIEAFNRSDWETASDLLGSSTYNEHGTQRSMKGADTIDAMQSWKSAMPDVRGTVSTVLETGDQVAVEVTWNGTHTGPMVTPDGEIPPSGRSQTTPAAWVFDFDGDSLRDSRHYFDMLTFLQQIGAA